MFLFATAAAMALSPQATPSRSAGATAQARATIRIVSAVTLRLGEGALNGYAPPVTSTVVHTEAAPRVARLIEFQ